MILASLVFLLGQPCPAHAADRVPLIYCTDLYHPHDDFDDHIDLATVFAIPALDVKAMLLDKGDRQTKSPGASRCSKCLP